ncbi:hypothetical protein SVAN01_10949 [Stagonosporopsis vannaccii]|nr:hypothetical protein SVAN01_10949 [Stagonosporopsis vannaccii]
MSNSMTLPNACLQLLLMLLVFLDLVAGCPPPYSDFDFLSNETHTTADLIRIALDASPYSPETAWMEVVTMSGKVRTPWPRGDIAYCFTEPHVREKYEDDILEGWKLWSDRLGTPGQADGFQLRVREFDFGQEQWKYCYLERKTGHDSLLW